MPTRSGLRDFCRGCQLRPRVRLTLHIEICISESEITELLEAVLGEVSVESVTGLRTYP